MEPTYRYEKRVLKLLQWKTPEKVWRLKSPTHTMFLEAYERVFPDARFVQTHRDVSKVLPSVCDLYYTMLQMGSPDIDPMYVGELNMDQWGIALDRCLAFRADPARDAQVLRHRLHRLPGRPDRRDPPALRLARRRSHRRHVDRMLAWRADNPKDKHGKPRVQRRGLRHHRRRARAALRASYRDRFASFLG